MEDLTRRQRSDRSRRVYRRRRTVFALVVLALLALLGWGVTAAVSAYLDEASDPESESSAPPAEDPTSPPHQGADGHPGAPDSASSDVQSSPTPTEPDETATEEPEPDRASEASWDPDSIHVLTNRQNPLDPVDYQPDDLVYPEVPFYGPEDAMQIRAEAAGALEELFAAGSAEGMELGLVSAYRSFGYQQQIYSARHAEVGTEETDLYMSRPGYSEHQTGLAADVISIANENCMLGECFAETPEGQWVAQHAHEHGFVVRYLEDMEHITGYPYEPWHLRYVGEETAEEVFAEDLTLEEYWDQEPAPDYDDDEPNPDHLQYTP